MEYSDELFNDFSPSPILALSQLSFSINSESPQQSQQSQNSQSQRIYSSLLSKPDFDDLSSSITKKIYRDVNPSDTFQPYSTADFFNHGAKPRPPRTNKRKKRKDHTPIITTTGSRELRTCHARLREYRPILENKMSKLPHWSDLERFNDIVSLSTMSLNNPEDERQSIYLTPINYGWDHDQGIGFREYDKLIVLIGYIIKRAPVKPGHVFRLCSEIGVIPIPLKPLKNSGLYLVDQTARIRLSFQTHNRLIKFHEMVSGVPVALKGMSVKGRFCVQDVLFATPPAPQWNFFGGTDVEMVFVSSLHVGSESSNPVYLDLLFDYLQGLGGSPVEQEKMLAPKTRVFFVGNLFCKRRKWIGSEGETLVSKHCKIAEKLDELLENLSQTMEVFIIPGENDPSHLCTLPQPPIHKQIFQDASARPTFQRLTNPAKINLSMSTKTEFEDSDMFEDMDKEFINLILTSGTNVRATMEFCDIECPLEMASKLLEWSHLYPISVADNELAEEILSLKGSLPHLYVVGGLSDFKVKEWNGVKIVGVPSFAKTATAVVFTKGCDIMPINFKICV